jgi:hypothetical protein
MQLQMQILKSGTKQTFANLQLQFWQTIFFMKYDPYASCTILFDVVM